MTDTRVAPFTVADLLAAGLARDPEHPAIIESARTWSYAELDGLADRVAASLRRDGVGAGDRVAFLADAPVPYLAVLIGSARIASASIPINFRLAPNEVAGILADSGARVLITSSVLYAGLIDVLDRVQVILLDGPGDPRAPQWDTWLATDSSHLPSAPDDEEPAVQATSAGDSGLSASAAEAGADPTVLQMYTSGTTGRPKGVMLSDTNLAASIPEICDLWILDQSSRMLGVLPLFHIAGLGAAAGTLWSGATFVIPVEISATALLDAVAEHGITNLVLASVLLQRFIEEAASRAAAGSPTDLSSLRVVGYGAAPISQGVVRQAMTVLPCGLLQIYGLTESSGTITALREEDHDPAVPDRLRSCGRPLASVDVRIVDPASFEDLAAGEVGEIWARSAKITAGYWQAPEATSEVITSDGWFRTGDLAYADDDGYIYLCDRLRDMIITGGENVYPAEVEDVLHSYPAVAEAAVIGVPDDRWGETPNAVVVARAGTTIDEAELMAFTRDHLAHFKCPTSVHVVDALPRNATGKVLRRILREPFWSGQSRLVN
jgi:long-chain acyl-CoA synthetase